MTWHQWHHTASRSSSTNRFSRLACANTASDHGCHASLPDFVEPAAPPEAPVAFDGLALPAGSWASATAAMSRNETKTVSWCFIVVYQQYANTRENGCYRNPPPLGSSF